MSAFVRSHTCYLQTLATVCTTPSYLKYSSAIYDSTGPMEHADIKVCEARRRGKRGREGGREGGASVKTHAYIHMW